MDDKRGAFEAAGLPADFVPLRLLVQATGTAIELNRPDMVLGRHSEADVRLPLPDVSRRHCRFTFRDGSWHLKDLKSLNGTYLNDFAVEEAQICHGEVLRIGGFNLTVDLAPARLADKERVLPMKPILPTISPETDQARRAS